MASRKYDNEEQLISFIIPAFRQEKTIEKDILQIKENLERIGCKYELIVVVDGRIDHTYENAKKIQSPHVKVVGYEHNYGKGYAVRYGMARAKGNLIAFIDAGMDLNPSGISILLEHFKWYNADIIVGSKLHPVSRVNYPFARRVLSLGYRMLVKILFGLSIRDTQVGMKIFRRKVLEDVLPRLLVKTYAIDIEMLAVAYRLGYKRIYEAPIELSFNGMSSITTKGFWKTILLMLWDTMAVFYRLRIVKYYDDANKRKWKFNKELNYRVNIS